MSAPRKTASDYRRIANARRDVRAIAWKQKREQMTFDRKLSQGQPSAYDARRYGKRVHYPIRRCDADAESRLDDPPYAETTNDRTIA